TGLAFGAEGGVDLEAGGPDHTHHRAGDASGHVQIAFGYEDDVDIADVVEFAPPGLAHGDHRQLGGVVRFGAGFLPCDVQPNAEGGFGESGEAPGDLGVGGPLQIRLDLGAEVRRRHLEQESAVAGA